MEQGRVSWPLPSAQWRPGAHFFPLSNSQHSAGVYVLLEFRDLCLLFEHSIGVYDLLVFSIRLSLPSIAWAHVFSDLGFVSLFL